MVNVNLSLTCPEPTFLGSVISSDEPHIIEQGHPPAGSDSGEQPRTVEAKLDDLTQSINHLLQSMASLLVS